MLGFYRLSTLPARCGVGQPSATGSCKSSIDARLWQQFSMRCRAISLTTLLQQPPIRVNKKQLVPRLRHTRVIQPRLRIQRADRVMQMRRFALGIARRTHRANRLARLHPVQRLRINACASARNNESAICPPTPARYCRPCYPPRYAPPSLASLPRRACLPGAKMSMPLCVPERPHG